jgi:hypothetical protein
VRGGQEEEEEEEEEEETCNGVISSQAAGNASRTWVFFLLRLGPPFYRY